VRAYGPLPNAVRPGGPAADVSYVARRGVPVRIGGRMAGAVAVSGATSVQDHEIAACSMAAAGGRAQILRVLTGDWRLGIEGGVGQGG
jgi:hypothetical protein